MPRGRKRIIQITPEVFEGMCRVQCTEIEIAKILGVAISTLKRWVRRTYKQSFEQVYANHAQIGKMSLRRAQMKSAVDELNPSMLKWLGQQYLGQRDKQDVDVHITDEREIAEATIARTLELYPNMSRAEAVEFSRKIVPEVDKLASELVQ